LINREKGQGLVEYALILVFIAVIVIAITVLFGETISDTFFQVACDFEARGLAWTTCTCENGAAQRKGRLHRRSAGRCYRVGVSAGEILCPLGWPLPDARYLGGCRLPARLVSPVYVIVGL